MLTEGCWSCCCAGQLCWCYYAASWPPSMSQVGGIQSPNTQSCDHQVAMSQTQQCLGVRCIIGHPSSGQMWSATMDTNLSVCSNALWTLFLHVSFIWGECLSQDQVFTQFIATLVGLKQFYVGWTLQTNLSKDEDTWGHWTTLSVMELWIICGAGDTCWGTDKMYSYIVLGTQFSLDRWL